MVNLNFNSCSEILIINKLLITRFKTLNIYKTEVDQCVIIREIVVYYFALTLNSHNYNNNNNKLFWNFIHRNAQTNIVLNVNKLSCYNRLIKDKL